MNCVQDNLEVTLFINNLKNAFYLFNLFLHTKSYNVVQYRIMTLAVTYRSLCDCLTECCFQEFQLDDTTSPKPLCLAYALAICIGV